MAGAGAGAELQTPTSKQAIPDTTKTITHHPHTDPTLDYMATTREEEEDDFHTEGGEMAGEEVTEEAEAEEGFKYSKKRRI